MTVCEVDMKVVCPTCKPFCHASPLAASTGFGAAEMNDLCASCAGVAYTGPVLSGGHLEKLVIAKSPWHQKQALSSIPRMTVKSKTMTPVSGSQIGDMLVGTWTLLDMGEVKDLVAKMSRSPIKDPRSECPCGGGLLRMDCEYHR